MDFTNVTKALTARGFKVSSFETAKEAAEYLNTQIDGATVGFGGSITLEELGLYALLTALAGSTALLLYARRRLGGVTGDVFGCTVECTEWLVLLTFCTL